MDDRTGSVRLARFGPVEVFIHWSWLIIATLLTLGFWGQLTETNDDLAEGRAWLLAVVGSVVFFASVLVHELAHAFMAIARGIEVRGITLYLFGGATEADASSRTAADELIIAVVGPLTSLGIAALLGAAWAVLDPTDPALGGLLGYLAVVNVILALFNLVPGLPLDGGRVLRATVWAVTGDFAKATRWAASGGVAIGYLLIGAGLVELWTGNVGGLWFAAIGWMISAAARRTEQQERLRDAFAGQTAADVMTTPVLSVPADEPLATTVRERFARFSPTVFPVVDGERIVGTIGVASVQGMVADEVGALTSGQVARPTDPALLVEPTRPMHEIVALLAGSREGTRVIVVEDGRPVGIISPRDVVRRSALAGLLSPRIGPR